MKIFFYGILTIISIVCLSCKEEEEQHPLVKSLPSEATSATSCLLKGEVVSLGDFKVSDHGFIYALNGYSNIENGTKISMGKAVQSGAFEKEISDPLLYSTFGETKVTFRAFLTNELGTAYGEPQEIKLPTLSVTRVEPLAGEEGDEIIIYGTNFKAGATDYQVFFNNTKGTILRVEVDKIIVVVPGSIDFPDYYFNENVKVTLRFGSAVIEATNNFSVDPTIYDFLPKSGSFGTNVTIKGTNFNRYNLQIIIGQQTIYPSTVSSNNVTFSIPENVSSESLAVGLIYRSRNFTFDDQFLILPPTISQITPLSGPVGQWVTITGTNFSGYSTKVSVGGVSAYVYSPSSTSFWFYIPGGLSEGAHEIQIKTLVHTITSSDDFTVTSP